MKTRSSLKREVEFCDSEVTPRKIAPPDELIIQAEEEKNGDEPQSHVNSIKLWHPKLLLIPPYFKYVRQSPNTLTVRCYSCGDLQTIGRNSKAMLTNHLKQEHPNIYETYQKYRRRRVPRSLQKEALNIEETYHIEVNEDHIPTPPVEVKKEHVPTFPIEIKKEHIPKPPTGIKKEHVPIPTIEIKEEHVPKPPIEIKEEHIAIPLIEIKEEHIPIPPIEIKEEHIPIPTIIIRKEDIPTPSIEENKDNDSTSNQQDCYLAPYVKMLFEPPYFQIIKRAANGVRLTVRCCNCEKELTSSYTGFSYLKKHVQHNHPDLCKKYEEIKMKHFFPNKKSTKYFDSAAKDKKDGTKIQPKDVENVDEEFSEALNFDLSPHIGMPGRMLFEPPFFRIIRKPENIERLALRCCTCGKCLTTSFTGASYLKKHVQKFHPDLCQIYDRCRWKNLSVDSVKFIYSDEKDPISPTKTNADNNPTGKVNANATETSKQTKNAKESLPQCSSNAKNTECQLSDKSWKILETSIDQRLNSLVKETGYFQLESKINKLMEDNTDKDNATAFELESDIESLKKECQTISLTVKQSQADRIKLQNELRRLNTLLNGRKLIIKNIKITNKKKPLNDVENVIKKKLNLSELKIVNCTIIFKTKTSVRTFNNRVCVAVELLSPEDCRLVLSQVNKLKNTGISIEPVLSPLLRKYENKLMVLRKELLKRKSDLKVSVRNAILMVNGKKFYWDDIEGLCHDFTLPEAVDLCGVEYLKNLTGLDLKVHRSLSTKYSKGLMDSSTPEVFVATLKEDSQHIEDNQHQVATLQENIVHVERKSKSTEHEGKRLIFTPPFFKIVHEPAGSERVTVRCYSCGVLRKCSYHSYAHLKTHLKRLHPKLHTLFEKHRWKVGWSTRKNYSDSAKKQAVAELENELKLINQRQVSTVKDTIKHIEDNSKSSEFARKRLILNSPFFKIIQGFTNDTGFKVRCCLCRVVKKCGYNSTVHLSRHLKHFHPNLHTLYEKYKRQGVVDFAEKETVLMEVKSEVIESDQENPVGGLQLKMPDNDLKEIVCNFNTADIATTSKNANYFSSLDTDDDKEKLKTYTADLGNLIFKPPFFEILSTKGLAVRCYTCGLVQKNSDVNAVNLTEHIKSLHPHVFKKYEEHIYIGDDASIDSITSSHNLITEKPIPNSNKSSEMEDTLKERDENVTPTLSTYLKEKRSFGMTIFKKPFFDIIRVFEEDPNRLLVRCHTCHVVKKSTRYNASHLTAHIRRVHPLIYKLYVEQKKHTNNRFQTRKRSQNARDKSDISLKNLEGIVDRTLRKLVNHTGYYAIRHRLTILTEDTVQKKYSSNMLKLQSDIENLKEECKALRLDVKKTNVSKIKLQNEIQRLDSLLNERKLIIINMKITNRRQPWRDVENLFKNKLNLNEIKIVRCTVSRTQHRTSTTITTIELLRPEDCSLVLSQVDKLKNTGITIEPELSPLLRAQRNKLMILRKELLSRKPELNVTIRYATLIVEGKEFYWDKFDGLCHDFTCPEATEIDSVKYMNQLTGLDVSEFIYVLRQYHIRGY